MIVSDYPESLSAGSHFKVRVRCDYQAIETCRKEWTYEYKTVTRFRKNNAGTDICLQCSRYLKYSGRANPNCKYKTLDDDFWTEVSSEAKAYLLGWYASDGGLTKGTATISIAQEDIQCLRILKDLVCPELPIKKFKEAELDRQAMFGFTVNSQKFVRDLANLLEIEPKKKSHVVRFPKLGSDALSWAFIRGLFDGDGTIASTHGYSGNWSRPRCSIASSSPSMKKSIEDFVNIPCYVTDDDIFWDGANSIDFMSKMYDNSTLYLSRKKCTYVDWCSWVPGLQGYTNYGKFPELMEARWVRACKEARPPTKNRASDTGWDVEIISEARKFGDVTLYDTGLKVRPPHGWYFDLVPRSSVAKSGYMLANSFGVIDRGYVGTVMVPLRKVNQEAPDLLLPAKVVQLVLRPIIHAQFIQVESFDETTREAGGFGSTDVQ